MKKNEDDVWSGQKEGLFKPENCNGNNEMVKIFNQKCLISFENFTFYAFRQCGHQCV